MLLIGVVLVFGGIYHCVLATIGLGETVVWCQRAPVVSFWRDMREGTKYIKQNGGEILDIHSSLLLSHPFFVDTKDLSALQNARATRGCCGNKTMPVVLLC